ncbi:hypothetical protein J31TS6_44020 [Brevibacillus reuszeri]|nr:hypothetical protein J31TS6_44020 [Brevibacillus reuszeri]
MQPSFGLYKNKDIREARSRVWTKKTGESALPEGRAWTYDQDEKKQMRMRITTKIATHCVQERIETWKELHEEPKKAGCP